LEAILKSQTHFQVHDPILLQNSPILLILTKLLFIPLDKELHWVITVRFSEVLNCLIFSSDQISARRIINVVTLIFFIP
jgi:hypothetical protein